MIENNNTPATEFGAPAPYTEGSPSMSPYAEPSAPAAPAASAEDVHAPEPVTLDAGDLLAELEQLGVPATSLLDALSEALAGPRGAYVAIHLVWAVNRCRGLRVLPAREIAG